MAGICRKRKRNRMENNKIKIVFLGTGLFGEIILKGLFETGYRPILANDFKKIKILEPDLVVVASYGKIIPREILKIPQYGCLNIHGSLLPKYRGPSPIQTTILNNDKETGVTIILMDEKIDHGPIVANYKLQITNYKITYEELLKELATKGAKLLAKTLPKWINGEIKPEPQDESKATYTKIIKKDDGKINWSKSAAEIERQIRAFNPWPGSFTFWKKNKKIIRVKILEAEVSQPTANQPKAGKSNQLIIKKLQPEGKKPMAFEDFKRGYHDFNLLL